MIESTRPVAAVLVLCLLCGSSSEAQSARDDVAAQLKVVTDAKTDEGFVPDQAALGRSILLGVLEDQSSVYLEMMLDERREYHIAARCDSGCANIDTSLLSPGFDPVAEDLLDNDMPKLQLKPAGSGPHLLAVRMASCKAQICYFGIVVLSRPVP